MTKVLAPDCFRQHFDNSGDVLNGGLIDTYVGGTSTLATTWTDSTGGTAQANPIVLDSAGREAGGIWITAGVAYKFRLRTSAGVTLDTVDNIAVWGTDAETAADEEIDVTFSYVGTPSAQGNIGTYPATRSFTFPVNFAGSRGSVGTIPAASYEMKVYRNGVQIGTVTVAQTTGTFTFATTGGSTYAFVAGDILTMKGPDSVGTAADIGVTFLADID
jgi:hypothetical protein